MSTVRVQNFFAKEERKFQAIKISKHAWNCILHFLSIYWGLYRDCIQRLYVCVCVCVCIYIYIYRIFTYIFSAVSIYIYYGCKSIKFFNLINYMMCRLINLINHKLNLAVKIPPKDVLKPLFCWMRKYQVDIFYLIKWKWLSTDGPHPTWLSLRGFAKKNGRKSPNPGAKVVVSYPKRLEAVIASTKYWVKGLNIYVNVIFQFFLFNKFTDISKILFSLCHYEVRSVDYCCFLLLLTLSIIRSSCPPSHRWASLGFHFTGLNPISPVGLSGWPGEGRYPKHINWSLGFLRDRFLDPSSSPHTLHHWDPSYRHMASPTIATPMTHSSISLFNQMIQR